MGVHGQLLKKRAPRGGLLAVRAPGRGGDEKAELRVRLAEVERACRTGEASNQAKSLFLANIVHELRTPMNAILGYARLLQRAGDIPKHHRHAIETIEKSGGHLLALINDVLDLSKIEAGCMDLQLNDFDLSALLYDLSAMFDIRSSQKQLQWRVEIWHPPEGPLGQVLNTTGATPGMAANPTLGSDIQIQM